MKKKILLLILTLILVTNCMAFANTDVALQSHNTCCSEHGFVKGYILNGIIEKHGGIDFSGFGLSADEMECYVREVINENPGKTAGVLSYNVNSEVVFLEYDDVLTLFESAEVAAEKAKILSLVDDDMTDMEKALVVHDYMAQNYEYDMTYSIYSADGIFKNKKGVCQAYALAYIEIMKELGVECKFVPSIAMNHAWNLIKIDGEWYHIDITWDDPTPDLLGRVWHKFFLVSDSAIVSTEYFKSTHYGWDVPEKATSTKYDGFFWYDIEKPIIDNGGFWYFIRETDTKPAKGQMIKKNISTGAESTIYTIEDIWFVWGTSNRYWNGCFSGIGIMDGRIYFNTPKKIQSIKLDGTGIKTELTPNTSSGNIYGLVVSDHKIVYGLSTSPNNGIESKATYYIQYSVTFDGNGGAPSFAYKNVTKTGIYGILPDAKWEGYIFKGWYTEKEGGVLVTNTSPVAVDGDHTLYARWEKVPPEIEVTPEKAEGKCIVSVNPKWVEEKCFIFVACFKDGKLSHIERRLYSGSEEKFIADDGSDVKIMLWGCDELSNVCSKILIGKSEFEN